MKLWLDDIRIMPDEFDFQVTNYDDCIVVLMDNCVDFISFDHDLGDTYTGYDVASFIEYGAYQGWLQPIDWEVHSANPVGRERINKAMRSAHRFWAGQKRN